MQTIPTWNCQKAELEMTNLCGRAMLKSVCHAHILKFILVEFYDSTSKNNWSLLKFLTLFLLKVFNNTSDPICYRYFLI